VNRLSRQCGSLDVSQRYGPPRPVTGIDLLLGVRERTQYYHPRMMMSVVQLVEWELEGETEVLAENLPQCHCVHHKSHTTWARTRTTELGRRLKFPLGRTDRQSDCVELKSFSTKNRLRNVISVLRQRRLIARGLCTVKAKCSGTSVSSSVEACLRPRWHGVSMDSSHTPNVTVMGSVVANWAWREAAVRKAVTSPPPPSPLSFCKNEI
jgi:hypothetical protein